MSDGIEIARYPIRCARCGRRDEVRVIVPLSPVARPGHGPFSEILPTVRLAPIGWRYRYTDRYEGVEWLCPDCGARVVSGDE